MKPFTQTIFDKLPLYWKLSTIRCGLYALIVAGNTFQAGVEGYDSMASMTPLQKGKLAWNIIAAMFGVWLAFIDTTISKVQGGDHISSTDVHTEFRQPTLGPTTPPGGAVETKT